MTFIDLTATKCDVDVKKAGLVTYTTDQVVDVPGIIVINNPSGEFGMTLVDSVHEGGPVIVKMRAAGIPPVKRYEVGDVIAKIAVF